VRSASASLAPQGWVGHAALGQRREGEKERRRDGETERRRGGEEERRRGGEEERRLWLRR